jgi:signal peptidase II
VNLKKLLRNYLFLFAIAGIIILLDQLSKEWIENTLAMGETYCVIDSICQHVRFVHWYNTGVAFGMFQGNGDLFKITSTIIAAAIILIYAKVPDRDWLLRLALAFETGGAIGNLIDRYTIGHVTDFIAVGNFAVFNIADASINIGVAIMLLSLLLDYLQERKEKQISEEDTAVESSFAEQEENSNELNAS